MTVFNNNDIATNQSLFVNYTLINMKLFSSDVQTKSSTEGNYRIAYNSGCLKSSSDYQVKYYNPRDNGNPHTYCAVDFYFYSLYHDNIQNYTDSNGLKDLIGELIIECVDSSVNHRFFLCFLLQSVKYGGTDDQILINGGSISKIYDNIIIDKSNNFNYGDYKNGATTVSLSGDGTIPPQNSGCIIYYDNYNDKDGKSVDSYIMINLNPITISNANVIAFLSSLSPNKVPPFKKYPNEKADILTSTIASSIIKSLGFNELSSNPKLAALLGTSSKSNIKSAAEKEVVDNEIYIDCNPTGASEEEIATYNLPINSALTGDLQNASFAQLCSNFALFALLLIAAYAGIPAIFTAMTKNASGPEHYYVQRALVGYFCILFIGLLAEGFSNGNMLQISAGILMVVLAVLTYVITTYKLLGMNIGGDFDAKDFIKFLIGLVLFLITDAYILILVCWIIFAISLVIMYYVYNYEAQYVLDLGLWIGLAGILPLVGFFTYISK